jgi:hypothetical protein
MCFHAIQPVISGADKFHDYANLPMTIKDYLEKD